MSVMGQSPGKVARRPILVKIDRGDSRAEGAAGAPPSPSRSVENHLERASVSLLPLGEKG